MSVLVALLSQGKGTWSQLKRIIELGDYEKVFLITNTFGLEKYAPSKGEILINIDLEANTLQIRDSIIKELKEPLSSELEVDLNIASGSGKEHAAAIAAMFKVGVGIRIVDLVEDKVEEI